MPGRWPPSCAGRCGSWLGVVEDLLTSDKRLVEEGVCVCLVFGKTLIREFAIVGWVVGGLIREFAIVGWGVGG